MRPSKFLITAVACLFLVSVLACFFPRATSLLIVLGAMLGVLALVDGLLLWSSKKACVTRELPSRLALGIEQAVGLVITNTGSAAVYVEAFDGLPDTVKSRDMPWSGRIKGGGFSKVEYRVVPLERGTQKFLPAHLLQDSPMRLWRRAFRSGPVQEIKVFPNYEPVIRFSLLATANRENQMGIISRNKTGISKEFHQLRDYQDGDILTQVDWKATSRRNQLISREYRQQRDQTIIFALDCGRRMRAMDGNLSQFDHCLNAILLLSYIALRQGDSVGILGFGGNNRWLAPLKGAHSMTAVLSHLYDYQASGDPSDFSEAAERILVKQKRRALVIFLTNLRSEDASHILLPLKTVKKKHVTLLASLREQSVASQLGRPVTNLDDALTYTATHMYLEDREAMLRNFRDRGILTIDETAELLPVALSNKYLEIKKEGRI